MRRKTPAVGRGYKALVVEKTKNCYFHDTLTVVHLPDIIAFMSDSAQDSSVQTMTVVGKALVSDDSTALSLGLLGFSATKLWNTAVWHTRKVWAGTGKIPTYPGA